MILLDIFEQREPHQLAIDALAQRRIEQIEEYIANLKKAMEKVKDAEQRQAIQDRIAAYEKERVDHTLGRTVHEVEQPQRPPAKGLLKGKDLVTPQQRVAGATPAKPGVMGAVKDVVGGIKRFVKGEPDQGPTFEQQNQNPNAPGTTAASGKPFELTMQEPKSSAQANYAALKQAYRDESGGKGTTLSFLDEKDPARATYPLTKYAVYNILATLTQTADAKRPALIEKVLNDRDSFEQWLNTKVKQYQFKPCPKSWRIKNPGTVPPRVPANPPAAEPAPAAQTATQPDQKKAWNPFADPLSERTTQKKKSNPDDISPGDVKTARELQKIRVMYPAARSDVEALARAEIDSSERAQRAASSLKSSNAEQDALIQQIMANDREQEKTINDLENVDDRLELQVDRVQAMNQRLAQRLGGMTGARTTRAKPAATAQATTPTTIDLIPGAPADVGQSQRASAEVARLDAEIQKLKAQASTSPQNQAQLLARITDLENARAAETEKRSQAARKAAATRASKKAAADDELKKFMGRMTMTPPAKQPKKIKSVVAAEGKMKNIDLMRQELQRLGDKRFIATYGMTPDQVAKMDRPAPQQDVPVKKPRFRDEQDGAFLEATAQQFGQAVRMAGYTGRELEKDPAYRKAAQHARQEREQSQQNLARVKAGYGDEPEDYRDVDETFAMPGTTVPRKAVIQGYTVFFNPETRTVSVTRGGDSEEAAIEQQRIGTVNLKTFRQAAERLIDKIEGDEQLINEGAKDAASATAVIACLLTGGSLSGCATAPQQTSAQQVLKTGQDIGRVAMNAKKITRAGTEAEVQQELRNIMRGISGRPEELNNSNILRIWRRIKGQPPVPAEPEVPEYGPAEPRRRMPQSESTEPRTKQEFDRAQDGLLNQSKGADAETRKRINQELKQLQDLGRRQGWFKGIVREDTAALAAEDAILKRIFVRHRDLMMEYGPDKITQAAEEVAYNVGDIAHITDEQITEWVGQVEYILGARP